MLAYKSSYYNIVVPLMAHAITKRCGREVTRACKKDSHRIYRDLLTKAPNIGKNNPMEHNIYMAIALFSLQLSSKGALSVEDFKACAQDMMALPIMRVMGIGRDFNDPKTLAKYDKTFHEDEQWRLDHLDQIDCSWEYHFDDRHKDGVFYYCTRCPINDFCWANGLLRLLPAMCAIDYPMCRLEHAILHRDHTLAEGGPCCDFWIVGDKIKNPH
jgi:hypothetical protein